MSTKNSKPMTPQPTKRKRLVATKVPAQLPRTRCNDIKHKWSTFNSQAGRRGIVQGLTFQEYSALVNMPCSYCGQGSRPAGSSEGPRRLVGVDRIDSGNRHYCLYNCVPCCSKCNFMKGSLDHHEFLSQVRAIAAWRTGVQF